MCGHGLLARRAVLSPPAFSRTLPHTLSHTVTAFTNARHQVAREGFVIFFSEVFDAMFRLCADSEANVQNAVQFLDNLVKVRVAAWSAAAWCSPAAQLMRRTADVRACCHVIGGGGWCASA